MDEIKKDFIADVADKKRTARSAHSKAYTPRRVRFPSDYLTEKERKQMNSDVASYNLNQPMSWAEYKKLPDDLKEQYLRKLRERYGATAAAIGKMMGVNRVTVSRELESFGIPAAKQGTRQSPEWENFVRYGTPMAKAVGKLEELVPPDVKARLDEWEKEHPPAVIAPQSSTAAEPANRVSVKTYGRLCYIHGLFAGVTPHDDFLSDAYKAVSELGEIIDSMEIFI